MKYNLIVLVIILIFSIGCNNNENQLLLKQQELLEYHMDRKSADIVAIYMSNKIKYGGSYIKLKINYKDHIKM